MSYDPAGTDPARTPRTRPAPRHLGARAGAEHPESPEGRAKGPAAPGVSPDPVQHSGQPGQVPPPPPGPGTGHTPPHAGQHQAPPAPPATPNGDPAATAHFPPITADTAPPPPSTGHSTGVGTGTGTGTGVGTGAGTGTAGHVPPAPAADPRTGAHGVRTGDRAGDRTAGHDKDHDELLPAHERDELTRRMQHALSEFVDSPQRAVREAAGVLEAATEQLTAALDERRRSLRTGWDGDGEGRAGRKGEAGPAHDTEQLRVTLRAYREMTERLLRL
ncbi:hypothetical protein [Streptomyces lichenis]|uniref:Uncharacterized protein n=1 Tax=Streptomyces lichenis TaxID=2306967 RepID=A0ABT0IJ58_9ACTN|nr:hypothetical protein [Streptomyces lichenis]MCK8681302.1 hypothetical protein [Streptomyces lichenis]